MPSPSPTAPARRPSSRQAGALLLLAAVVALVLPAAPAPADDSIPTDWMLQAGTAPLLHAPPPPVIPTICIIDTGVTPTPDLDIADRTSLVGTDPNDVTALPGLPGHGTTVAHFAAGKVNGWGGAGAFPHARITSVRVFATANGTADWQDYLRALNACRQRSPAGLKVIVVSLGGQAIPTDEALELENRINVIRSTYDISVVAAAGNGGGDVDAPGRFPASFTVAASARDSALCTFSARGEAVDIAAPGCSVEQGGWAGSEFLVNGTSFAAPIVAGALAAVRAYAPELSASAAERLLVETARRPYASSVPLLDVNRALAAIGRRDFLTDQPRRPTDGAPATDSPMTAPPQRASPSQVAPIQPVAFLRPPRHPILRMSRRPRKRLLVRAMNRPRGAILEVRLGTRTERLQASKVTVRLRGESRLRARFVTSEAPSAWTIARVH